MPDVLRRSNPVFRPLGCFAPVAVNSGLRPETRKYSKDGAAVRAIHPCPNQSGCVQRRFVKFCVLRLKYVVTVTLIVVNTLY